MIYKIFVFKILCDFHVICCDSCLILKFIKVIPEKKIYVYEKLGTA